MPGRAPTLDELALVADSFSIYGDVLWFFPTARAEDVQNVVHHATSIVRSVPSTGLDSVENWLVTGFTLLGEPLTVEARVEYDASGEPSTITVVREL